MKVRDFRGNEESIGYVEEIIVSRVKSDVGRKRVRIYGEGIDIEYNGIVIRL